MTPPLLSSKKALSDLKSSSPATTQRVYSIWKVAKLSYSRTRQRASSSPTQGGLDSTAFWVAAKSRTSDVSLCSGSAENWASQSTLQGGSDPSVFLPMERCSRCVDCRKKRSRSEERR